MRLSAILCFLIACAPSSRGDAAEDYDLKAVFLFNFAQFIDWPPEAFANPGSPIVIGILGDNPFGKRLEQVVRNESIRGRKLIVKQFRGGQEIDCEILFISASEAARLNAILDALEGKPILTVGESQGFAASGGMIQFFTDQNRIRFKINKDAVSAGQLMMSSKLLKTAHEIVETTPP